MDTINHSLYIGTPKRGIDLFCNVAINGRHKFRMHSESFVGTFLQDIHGLMHGGKVKRLCAPGDQYLNAVWGRYGVQRQIDGTVRFDIANSSILGSTDYDLGDNPDPSEIPMWVHVYNCNDIPDLNSAWRITKFEGGQRYIFVEGVPEEFDLSLLGDYWGMLFLRSYFHVSTFDQYKQPFRDIVPTVGSSNTPVSIHDIKLGRSIDHVLSIGSRSVSPLVTDQEKSVFTISTPFTNDTGNDVTIHELGLMARGHTNSRFGMKTLWNLYARDVLDAPTYLPHGKTLSLDYECRFELENFNQDTDTYGSNGGFLERFANAVRMQSIATSRVHPEAHLMAMGFGGGRSNIDTNTTERRRNVGGWEFGIRLGESNKFVSMTDQQLSPDAASDSPYNQGGIRHGDGDGELIHHGMYIDDEVKFDGEANSGQFTIARVFENRGSIPITVKEIGLYGSASTSTSAVTIPGLMARRALQPDDQFTIGPGEMKKVSYTIKIVA